MAAKVSASSPKYGDALGAAFIVRWNAQESPQPPNFEQIHQLVFGTEREEPDITPDQYDQYRKKVIEVSSQNETALLYWILPYLLDHEGIVNNGWLRFDHNTRWTDQIVFSNELGKPQPDNTLGLQSGIKAREYRDVISETQDYYNYIHPGPKIVCPMLTLEAKSPDKSIGEAFMQNQHNGACMVKNLVALKQAANVSQQQYHNQIQVLTIELHWQTVQISCHWTDGNGTYYSEHLGEPISLFNLSKARQITRNAVDWTKQELQKLDSIIFTPLMLADQPRTRKRGRPSEPENDSSNGKRART